MIHLEITDFKAEVPARLLIRLPSKVIVGTPKDKARELMEIFSYYTIHLPAHSASNKVVCPFLSEVSNIRSAARL
jgi:hypothetical protein